MAVEAVAVVTADDWRAAREGPGRKTTPGRSEAILSRKASSGDQSE